MRYMADKIEFYNAEKISRMNKFIVPEPPKSGLIDERIMIVVRTADEGVDVVVVV